MLRSNDEIQLRCVGHQGLGVGKVPGRIPQLHAQTQPDPVSYRLPGFLKLLLELVPGIRGLSC